MHIFLFTNSGQRELVSICTQSIHNFPCISTLLLPLIGMQRTIYALFVYYLFCDYICTICEHTLNFLTEEENDPVREFWLVEIYGSLGFICYWA